jgi:dTDP-L-rhamnose 4-epimerase
MSEGTILITGGAGFIGSHLADELCARGYRVRALDCLHPQVHEDGIRPSYLHPEVELRYGDVRDPGAVASALKGVDAVFHLAARVGVGQSMYEVLEYTQVNDAGTAVLLEALRERPVAKLVVASSMSVYGEGGYLDAEGAEVEPPRHRSLEAMRRGRWDFLDDAGRPLVPRPTPERHRCVPSSIYALGKYDQERMCLIAGEAYGFPATALRFFNTYGPRQALSNPYTGVLANFAARLLNGEPPSIFEDGEQQRDFVHVRDVARACRLALERAESDGQVINVGSGVPRTINAVARAVARALGRENLGVDITGSFRAGDVRHCFADLTLAREFLDYTPEVAFEEGLRDLTGWLENQIAVDRSADARAELSARGLVR